MYSAALLSHSLPDRQALSSALYFISMGGNDYLYTITGLATGVDGLLRYLPLIFQQVLAELMAVIRVRAWVEVAVALQCFCAHTHLKQPADHWSVTRLLMMLCFGVKEMLLQTRFCLIALLCIISDVFTLPEWSISEKPGLPGSPATRLKRLCHY